MSFSTDPKWEALAGPSFVVRDHVDYVFQDAPKTLRMKEGTRETRGHALLAEGGWKAAVALFANSGRVGPAAEVAARVALALKDDDSIEFALQVTALAGVETVERFATAAVEAAPGCLQAHRAFQSVRERAGRSAEILPRYREAYERTHTAQAGYLYARLLPPKEAQVVLAEALAAHPDDARLHRSAAWVHMALTRWADAVASYDRAAALDAKLVEEVVVLRATALVAVGRTADAQRLLLPAVTEGAFDVAVAYGRVRHLPGADLTLPPVSDVAGHLVAPGDDLGDARARIAALVPEPKEFAERQGEITDADARSSAKLELLALTDPDEALTTLEAGPAKAAAAMNSMPALVLVAELVRKGDAGRARAVYDLNPSLRWHVSFERFADPGAAALDEALPLEPAERAALAFAASRRATEVADRERWTAEVRRFDVLHVLPVR